MIALWLYLELSDWRSRRRRKLVDVVQAVEA